MNKWQQSEIYVNKLNQHPNNEMHFYFVVFSQGNVQFIFPLHGAKRGDFEMPSVHLLNRLSIRAWTGQECNNLKKK